MMCIISFWSLICHLNFVGTGKESLVDVPISTVDGKWDKKYEVQCSHSVPPINYSTVIWVPPTSDVSRGDSGRCAGRLGEVKAFTQRFLCLEAVILPTFHQHDLNLTFHICIISPIVLLRYTAAINHYFCQMSIDHNIHFSLSLSFLLLLLLLLCFSLLLLLLIQFPI